MHVAKIMSSKVLARGCWYATSHWQKFKDEKIKFTAGTEHSK